MAFEQHFQVTLKTIALVMGIGKNRQVTYGIKSILDAAQNGRAKRVSDIEQHHANALAALAAKEARHHVGAITKALGGFFNALPRRGGDIARQGCIIEDDGNGGGRKARGFGNVPHGDELRFPVAVFHGGGSSLV